MIICHITTMNNIDREGMITRDIYYRCKGTHIWCDIHSKPSKADIYILHCFKNPKHLNEFVNFEKPKGSKVISIIHSSDPCFPAKCSDVVVTISKTWQDHMKKYYNIDSVMIYPGIHIPKVKLDYERNVFGHIGRPERGKYHIGWNYLVLDLLKKYPNVFCRIASNKYNKLPIVKHDRMTYIEGIMIDEDRKKFEFLSGLSMYTVASETNPKTVFVDTFNVALLEAMACGLPCLIMGKYQPAMREVMGEAGMHVDTIEDFQEQLERMINNVNIRKTLGRMAKKRARFFSKSKFVKEWNKLLCEL